MWKGSASGALGVSTGMGLMSTGNRCSPVGSLRRHGQASRHGQNSCGDAKDRVQEDTGK
jgi:hypothetical protein